MLTAMLGIVLAFVAIYFVTKSVVFELRKGRATNVDWTDTPATVRTVPANRTHSHYAAR